MNILVINSGSSSIKSQLINSESKKVLSNYSVEEYSDFFQALQQLLKQYDMDIIDAFAHRVVHGGAMFSKSVIINEEVLKQLDDIEHLAPLHNPHNTQAIKIIQKEFSTKAQIAVFDTAFHQTMPSKAFIYPLPYEYYEKQNIRKYGFHGSSHAFLTQQTAEILNKSIDQLNIITLHLGNGASVCAIKNGRSIDTSMGFTPLEGLMMGTRCGDIDPSITLYLEEKLGKSPKEIQNILNKQSGFKGICDKSDLREIIELKNNGDEKAMLAVQMYIYRIIKYIGSYIMILKDIDAIVFSGGIGENSSLIRQMIVNEIGAILGTVLDNDANKFHQTFISTQNSKLKVMVVPTNEELYIALEAKNLLTKVKK